MRSDLIKFPRLAEIDSSKSASQRRERERERDKDRERKKEREKRFVSTICLTILRREIANRGKRGNAIPRTINAAIEVSSELIKRRALRDRNFAGFVGSEWRKDISIVHRSTREVEEKLFPGEERGGGGGGGETSCNTVDATREY